MTAEALVAGGVNVVAYDDNPASVEKAKAKSIRTMDLRNSDFSKFDALVLSPGVPLTHPKPHWTVEMAKASDLPIIGDVSLFAEERSNVCPDSPFIAITGTNGKSTTTALVSHVLSHSGCNVQMGGNIGRAVLSLDPFNVNHHYVVECSSYQIDLAPNLDASIGILLNLAPDHLDRHGTMEHYGEVKSRLVYQSETAIIGIDDPHTRPIAAAMSKRKSNPVTISNQNQLGADFFLDGGYLISKQSGTLINLATIPTLQGMHNAQNAAAAYAVCKRLRIPADAIERGLATFPGLAHRMEILGDASNIRFVNDSKATNADAAAMALASFDRIYWIAGGLAKDGGIESLRPLFDRIVSAYLIGEAAPEFASTLGGNTMFEIAGTLDLAVERAVKDATLANQSATILLSPACASFDQFANFELRGEAFREAVHKVSGFKPFGEQA